MPERPPKCRTAEIACLFPNCMHCRLNWSEKGVLCCAVSDCHCLVPRMTPLVAGLLSLLAVSSAAKLGDLPAAAAPAAPAAAQRLSQRLPVFGDRLSAFRRRPLFLPLPAGSGRSGNFSGPLLRLPPGVKLPANVSLPMLLPFLRRPGSLPLLPPPGVVLPENYSTRVARHQLPFPVR